MRIDVKQLSAANRRKGICALVVFAGMSVSAVLLYDLNSRKSELERLTTEVETMEAQSSDIHAPSPEERQEWAEQEEGLRRGLPGDESVPLLFAEITRIGSESNIQGISINTEEHILPKAGVTDGAEIQPTDDQNLPALGISHYSAVSIGFQGSYSDVARFLDAVSRLPYSVSVRSVELRRTIPLIDGTLLLHIYKRGAA